MRPSKRHGVRLLALVSASALLLGAPALAQNLAQSTVQDTLEDNPGAPVFELTVAQKQMIFQSISATQKNHAAPPGFRVTVGAHVPDMIELKPVSNTLAALIPDTGDYEIAMIEKQVVLVDRKSKAVVAVVTAD